MKSFCRHFFYLLTLSSVLTETFAAAGLDVGEQSTLRGASVAVDVLMQSDSNVAALQFDLVFDNSRLSVQSPSLAPSHSAHLLDSEIVAPGRLRVAVFSPLNSPLINGRLVTIPFKVGPNVGPGELQLALQADESILSTPVGLSVLDLELNDGTIVVEPGQGVVRIGGRIRYFGGAREALAGVELRLIGDEIMEQGSDETGRFEFDAPGGVDYVLDASLNGLAAARAGVDIVDIYQIRKHLESIENIENPLGVLAGDVNRNRSLDLDDIEMIRGLILGRQAGFIDPDGNDQTSFEFVSSDLRFSDPRDPWRQLGLANQNGRRSFSEVTSNRFNQDFSGLRLGDVNGDWVGAGEDQESLLIRDRLVGGVELQVDSEFAIAGDTVRVPVRGRGIGDLVAFQIGVRWDSEVLDFDGIDADQLPGFITEEQTHMIEPGHLIVVWDDPEAVGVSGEALESLMTLRFRGIGDPGAMTLVTVEDSVVEPMVLSPLVRANPDLVSGIVVTLEGKFEGSNLSTGRSILIDYQVNGVTRLWALGIDGEPYVLEATNRVDEPSWEVVDEQIAVDAIVSLVDPDNSEFQRYYRITQGSEKTSP